MWRVKFENLEEVTVIHHENDAHYHAVEREKKSCEQIDCWIVVEMMMMSHLGNDVALMNR
jgi:hypothetical protein